MKNDIATFVIPAYIRSKIYLDFLEQTIQGLINQTDSSWNAIIIEDCSPERGVEELINHYRKMDDRIHVIYLKKRESTGLCRNLGIKWAEKNGSSIILFNDADDISHCNRVKWVKNIFKNNSNISVIYSPIEIIDEHSNRVSENKLSAPIREILDGLKENPPMGANCWYQIGLKTGYINVTSSTSVRTELAVKELFPDEYVSEDSHTWFRYAARGEYYCADQYHCQYRIPSFVVRQSSNSYVKDFNSNKIRIEMDGFRRALEIALENGVINESSKELIEIKFLMRLMESMGKDGRLDLVFDVAMQCKEKLVKLEDGVCVIS